MSRKIINKPTYLYQDFKEVKSHDVTFIRAASELGYINEVKFLTKKYPFCEKNYDIYFEALSNASINGHTNIVKHLLKKIDKIDSKKSNYEYIELLKSCCEKGNNQIVKHLINKHPIIKVNKEYFDCLDIAFKKQDTDLLSKLLNTGKKTDEELKVEFKDYLKSKIDDNKFTPGLKELVRKFPDCMDNQCFVFAVQHKNMDLIKYLIKKHCTTFNKLDINIADNNGNNLLMLAIEQKDIKLVKFLLNNTQINIHSKNQSNKTVFDLAHDSGDKKIEDMLTAKVIKKHNFKNSHPTDKIKHGKYPDMNKDNQYKTCTKQTPNI